ncbi:Proline-rich receptor-like protein kinase PERK1 [Rhynchospora pubera]|uniref:non-specific serine/threonine protein kinase n=1 Tax=Rhynchospora pubera TaxID=906938 RepID=A0AAV8AUD3_9POAL|nr:Proline-rich receptor-like protein kinase PERK1 [Rhynchospora pubera]
MQVRVTVNSAHGLKNVKWPYGKLHPYAVVWIDSSAKCSTKIDLNNNVNPVWNEKFTIPLPPTSLAETAILYIDIVHANAAAGTNPLVGSIQFPLCEAINEAQANGNVSHCLNLLRPSGRSQGTVEIMIGVKNPDVGQINQFNEETLYKQHADPDIGQINQFNEQHAMTQPLPQPQLQPQAQSQSQSRFNPNPQIQPQGQLQPGSVVQPQGLQSQSQDRFNPNSQIQPQGQLKPGSEVQPKGLQSQSRDRFNPNSQIQPQDQLKPGSVVQPQGLHPLQQQVQPQSHPQPHPQLQPQVQPIDQYPKNSALKMPVVYPPNSQEIVRPITVQGPNYSMLIDPTYGPVKPVPVQKQNNPATAMGTRQEAARLNRHMLIPQNQNVQLATNNNYNGHTAIATDGVNDNGQTQCTSAGPQPHGMYKKDPYARSYQQREQLYDQDMVKPSSETSPSHPYSSKLPHVSHIPPIHPSHEHINSSGSGASSNYSGSKTFLPPSPNITFGSSICTFTYEELVIATDRFSDANLLGQGGFGYVHKGILPNGKEIAVKQLKAGSGQGEREFQAEIEIISRVHHRNLVSLVGYCISGGQRLLVYELVPNNTLEFHLHGKGCPTMAWSTRLRIALGAAKGLAYLHEDCYPKIIHRDIKAANILLDYKFEAKVADFGLAKFIEDNNTHVSTRVMGTFGYMAPEYAYSGNLTDKSDMFSFGVVLLELITGHRPVDRTKSFMNDSLIEWARPLLVRALEDGDIEPLVDPKLQKNYNANEMAKMVAVAAACIHHSAKRRPRMSQVVRALEGDSSQEDLNEGVKPGHSPYMGSYTSSDYNSSSYNEDIKKFRKLALESCEYPRSQYSVSSSEYSLNPSGSSSEGQHMRGIWKLGR